MEVSQQTGIVGAAPARSSDSQLTLRARSGKVLQPMVQTSSCAMTQAASFLFSPLATPSLFRTCLLALSVVTLAACSSVPTQTAEQDPILILADQTPPLPPSTAKKKVKKADPLVLLETNWEAPFANEHNEEPELSPGNAFVEEALAQLGTRYKYGGNSPDKGFDCSGLVVFASEKALGLKLPRRAQDIARFGQKIDASELQPGDLVFYNTLRRSYSHVGIYVGDGKFVHAPSSGGVVRVERMEVAYWKKRFNGARRLSSLLASAS